jgi:hypothetical protein
MTSQTPPISGAFPCSSASRKSQTIEKLLPLSAQPVMAAARGRTGILDGTQGVGAVHSQTKACERAPRRIRLGFAM